MVKKKTCYTPIPSLDMVHFTRKNSKELLQNHAKFQVSTSFKMKFFKLKRIQFFSSK